jgi:predicted transcriptional regulator
MHNEKHLKPLNPLLHSELRLAIISLLISLEEADFNYLKKTTDATGGNLSVQINKLKDAHYITVEKKFKDNYPLTICKITPQGIEAFEEYVKCLSDYINK